MVRPSFSFRVPLVCNYNKLSLLIKKRRHVANRNFVRSKECNFRWGKEQIGGQLHPGVP